MSEIIAEMILPAETLQQFVDVFTPLVSEGKIHVNDEGFQCTVVDPANISMIRPAALDAAAFESFDSPGSATIGINFERLSERLGKANAGDLVHLAVDMETRKLQIEYGPVDHAIAMIDPDAIRQEPDDPDLELPNEITVAAQHLHDAIDHIDMVTDHFGIEADPDAEEVVFRGQGDTDDTTYTLGHDELIEGHIGEGAESLFSIEYMKELTKPMPSDAEVAVTFGDEFPMMFDWTACDGHLDVHQMVAPRIQSR